MQTTLSPRTVLPSGWFRADEEQARTLLEELLAELSPKHPLQNKSLQVVAYRKGADDILCCQTDASDYYWLVQLNGTAMPAVDPAHPIIEMQGTYKKFLEYEESFD